MSSTTAESSRHRADTVRFADLPLRQGDPFGSAWGLSDYREGAQPDELGRLNLLTKEVTRKAFSSVQTGQRISLSLALNEPLVPMNPTRKACVHSITAKGYSNDDDVSFNTQASSQWDGFRHVAYGFLEKNSSIPPRYYNGIGQETIDNPSDHRLGIDRIARAGGIVARGVLLDYAAYAKEVGISYSPFTRHGITLEDLLACAEMQGTTFQRGDVLLIRTGWTEVYRKMTVDQQRELGKKEGQDRTHVGLAQQESTLRWLFDTGFVAAASDTVALEAWPPGPIIKADGEIAANVCMHEVLLSGWGMLIGESWDLDALALACHQRKKSDFLLTSMPLCIPGGVASPSNAVAIL